MLSDATIEDRLERIESKQDTMRDSQQLILAKVESLAGNGQPGRVGVLEKRMHSVEGHINFMRGKLVAYGSLGVVILAALEVALKFIH